VVRLHELQKLGADEIDLMVLKQAGVVSSLAIDARVIASGELSRKSRCAASASPRSQSGDRGGRRTVAAVGVEKKAGKKQARLVERRKAREAAIARSARHRPRRSGGQAGN